MNRVLYRTALALLLTANAAGLAVLVQQGHGLPPLLGAVSLAYVGLVVLGYALGAAWHVGRADACRWNRRRATVAAPSARTAVRPPAVPGRHAAAMAAVTAEPMRDLTPTIRYTLTELRDFGLDCELSR